MLNEFAKAEYVSDESLDLDEMLRHTSHSHVLIIINISYSTSNKEACYNNVHSHNNNL